MVILAARERSNSASLVDADHHTHYVLTITLPYVPLEQLPGAEVSIQTTPPCPAFQRKQVWTTACCSRQRETAPHLLVQVWIDSKEATVAVLFESCRKLITSTCMSSCGCWSKSDFPLSNEHPRTSHYITFFRYIFPYFCISFEQCIY